MRLSNALLSRLRDGRERLGIAVERLSPRSLRAEVLSRRGLLRGAMSLLGRAAVQRVRALRERAGSAEAVLNSLSPLAVLQRGYAICHDAATGAVITDAAAVSAGKDVSVRLARGRVDARVIGTHHDRTHHET